MAIRVAVNGYGTIGKRVADAVARQPDLELVGVAKTRPSYEAEGARRRGYPLYVAGKGDPKAFREAGLEVEGDLAEMLKRADVVIDCAPEQVGGENAGIYAKHRIRAIFQGGEKPEVAECSFTALANYEEALGRSRVRVVSCNTTGIARAAAIVLRRWGVQRWDTTIIRRAADPVESDRGPINGILPTFQLPSHHGPDVKTVLPELPIRTTAVVVPTTLMHVHVNQVDLQRAPADAAEVRAAFAESARFRLFRSWERVDGTPQVMEFARDRSAGRPDMMENVLWEDGLAVKGSALFFFQAIHQESVVVPENIDAVRAMFELQPDAKRSMEITDRTLGLSPSP
ncbi:MAG: type II glyceraldehyde-3-phosphate dehydrogenase [Thermoplasmata archaeon]